MRRDDLVREWMVELQSRGIEPNGCSPAEREQQRVLAAARGRTYQRRTVGQALAAAARAFRKALGRGGLSAGYVPDPTLDEWIERTGFRYGK